MSATNGVTTPPCLPPHELDACARCGVLLEDCLCGTPHAPAVCRRYYCDGCYELLTWRQQEEGRPLAILRYVERRG